MNCVSIPRTERTNYENGGKADYKYTSNQTHWEAGTRRMSSGFITCLRGKIDDRYEDDIEHVNEYLGVPQNKSCQIEPTSSIQIMKKKYNTLNNQNSSSRFTNFFRTNPLKRTKSVAKLERPIQGPNDLQSSRSHESLLSSNVMMCKIDLLSSGVLSVSPVHQSVLGRPYCFEVRGENNDVRYFSSGSRQECDLWVHTLRKSISPNLEQQYRTDNSLKMWIYEAKGIPAKKRYFCEINLDNNLFGRTSVKEKTELLFWGDYFDFPDIPPINVVTINIFREGDKKRRRCQHSLIGSVQIPIEDFKSRPISENWYPILVKRNGSLSRSISKDPPPTLRIKYRFQSIDILPIDDYKDFLQYLKQNYKIVCETLEPVLAVKAKEDIGQAFVLLMHAQNMASEFLTDVVAYDLLRVGDQSLTFRGNSLATKSMEAFLKLTGEQYLYDTLSSPISQIITSDQDCEVDPSKVLGSLSRQQLTLRNTVKNAWKNIVNSQKYFPVQLRDCFSTFRERLFLLEREDMADNLISASIFLRFICPAILSPSLFNLTSELPSSKATRNLTLVAKTLQTLANFTRFQGKENFMEFLNDFLEEEAPNMKSFLNKISTRMDTATSKSSFDWYGYIDQGKQLSILHHLLSASIQKLPHECSPALDQLEKILESITKVNASSSFEPTSQISQHINPITKSPNSIDGHLNSKTIRGVFVPKLLEHNICRYGDTKELPHVDRLNPNDYFEPIEHSYSTSSISSTSNICNNSCQTNCGKTDIQIDDQFQSEQIGGATNLSFNKDSDVIMTNNNNNDYDEIPAKKTSKIHANTLPRNNPSIYSKSSIEFTDAGRNAKIFQIGFLPLNEFICQNPNPNVKLRCVNGCIYNSQSDLHDSETSLLSDYSNSSTIHKHKHAYHNALPDSSDESTLKNASNMPMSLEDLDDLIKYAEENGNGNTISQKQNQSQSSSKNKPRNYSSGYPNTVTLSMSSIPLEAPHQTKNQPINYSRTRETNVSGPLAFKNPLYKHQKEILPSVIVNDKQNSTDNSLPNGYFTGLDVEKSSFPISSSSSDRSTIFPEKHISSTRISGVEDIAEHKNFAYEQDNVGKKNKTSHSRYDPINSLIPEYEKQISSISQSKGNQKRFNRRANIDTLMTLSDSSTDTDPLQYVSSQSHQHNTSHEISEHKQHRATRTVKDCERQVERIQASLNSLGHESSNTDSKNVNNDRLSSVSCSDDKDDKMKTIIEKLINMEEDLRSQQLKMSLALTHKQRVIEAQGHQIAALDAANTRLLNALTSLRIRYETTDGMKLSNTNEPFISNNNNN